MTERLFLQVFRFYFRKMLHIFKFRVTY